jgi:hypothetical protein
MRAVFIALIFGVFGLPTATFAGQCDDLAVAIYKKEPVFDARVESVIKNHSISKLAQELKEKGIGLAFLPRDGFDVDRVITGMGYPVQNRVVKKLMSLALPISRWLGEGAMPLPKEKVVTYELSDFALAESWSAHEEFWGRNSILQMFRVKAGNPEVFQFNREQVRARYGIAEAASMVSIYVHEKEFHSIRPILEAFPKIPNVIVISVSNWYETADLKGALGSGFRFAKLSLLSKRSNLAIQFEKFIQGSNMPLVILNDTRGRLPELYAASDQAVIIGPNNFFEPLMVGTPTLIADGEAFPYSRNVWKEMSVYAASSGGAVFLHHPHDPKSAVEKLLKIRRDAIQHPAFGIPDGRTRTALELLLDRIETLVRAQVGLKP